MPSTNTSARVRILVNELRPSHAASGSELSFLSWLDQAAEDGLQDAGELLAAIRSDHGLTEAELNDKYSDEERWGEHALYPPSDWRAEVENEETRQGYWSWVLHHMDIDLCEMAMD